MYLGEAVHKRTAYPGEHEAIVSQSLWDRVHAVMAEGARSKAGRTRAQTPALLRGIIFDADGRAMSPSHTRKGQSLYRYYVSQSVIRDVGRPTRQRLPLIATACPTAATAKRVIEKVRAAGIALTVLPIANLEMLGGPGRTPVNGGSSRVKELLDAGVNGSAGGDNMFDIWFRFNRMDPIDTAYITCLSAGMRTDAEAREAFEMTTSRPARMMGLADRGSRLPGRSRRPQRWDAR